jgi:hypothetical protein
MLINYILTLITILIFNTIIYYLLTINAINYNYYLITIAIIN